MAFSGADYANPDAFLPYREQIWAHVENLISTDKLKTVLQFWPELEFNDVISYKRLYPYHDRLTLPTDDETDFKIPHSY
jgi:hypothetical protein